MFARFLYIFIANYTTTIMTKTTVIQQLIIPLSFFLTFIVTSTNQLYGQIYLDSTQSVEARVEDLLSRMTLDEKVGQMAQAERQAFSDITDIRTYNIGSLLSGGGSVPTPNTGTAWADMYDNFQQQAMATRLKIPLIYGVDAVHGHNNVKGAVIFPHNIGLGCTRNPELVKEAARITAIEIKGTGLNWTFAPCIAVTRNERWGRTYEGFGETTDLVTMMGVASIKGLQGDSLMGKSSILACAKHYMGDGGTTNGTDQGNTEVDEQTLRELYLPAYIEAIEAGVGTVMASYSSWNGNKLHGHKYLLTDVLKEELGFQGFVVSDWAGIDQLSGDYSAQVEASINAGIDMVMLPNNYKEFLLTIKALVTQNRIPQSRIDDAVRRILRIKFQSGLFEEPFSDRTYTNQIGSEAHRSVARDCVRQSIVLLKKKDNVLPLLKDNMKIHVAGKNANDMGNQCGGWSITWQGSSGNITQGTTILTAIRNAVGTSTVTTSLDGSGAAGADIAVAVIGETPYAEGQGDRADLSLTSEDIATVRNLKQNGIPVIVILVSGRPMLLNPIIPFCDAIFAAWLPGTEGDGVADILFGDYEPKGLLSNSWPQNMSQVPVNLGDSEYSPLFEYNYGITTLANSTAGSAPLLYSALVSLNGSQIEVSFNKEMADPSTGYAGFSLKLNSLTVQVTEATLKTDDNTTILLDFAGLAKKGDKVYLSYTEGDIQSGDNGKLNSFSPVLVYNLLDDNKVHNVPGKIEAEDFYAMSGVQTENTTDTGGGMNVGWIDTGDWMDYMINVPVSGVYKVYFRTASQSTAGQIELKIADSTLAAVNVPITGGWQNWQVVNANCNLYKGSKLLRLSMKKGGFNLNWLEFILVHEFVTDTTPTVTTLKQNYPNPFYPTTQIEYDIAERCHVTLAVFDMNGRKVAELVNEKQPSNTYSIKLDALKQGLTNGTYLYKFQAGDYTDTKKLIVK